MSNSSFVIRSKEPRTIEINGKVYKCVLGLNAVCRIEEELNKIQLKNSVEYDVRNLLLSIVNSEVVPAIAELGVFAVEEIERFKNTLRDCYNFATKPRAKFSDIKWQDLSISDIRLLFYGAICTHHKDETLESAGYIIESAQDLSVLTDFLVTLLTDQNSDDEPVLSDQPEKTKEQSKKPKKKI